MKKIILILLSISLLLTLCACGGSPAPDPSAQPESGEAPAEEEAQPESGGAPAEEEAQPESGEAPAEEEEQPADPLEEVRLAIEEGDNDRALALLEPLAAGGNAQAKHLMGQLYLYIFGDPAEAGALLEEAAQAGISEAWVDLGRLFEMGPEGTPDYVRAADCYTAAAEAGALSGYYRLGMMYNSSREDGLHDFNSSEFWFKKGVEKGNLACCYGLGRLYAFGSAGQDGYGRDAEKALYYLQMAGEDRAEVLYVLGQLYHHGVTSATQFHEENGELVFDFALEPDPAKALDYYERALNCADSSGIAVADLVSLGRDLRDGRGVKPDAELAREAFRAAAEHGSEEAQELLQSMS